MWYPLLFGNVVPFLVEARYFAANDAFTKKRSLLHIEKRGDLSLKLNQSFEVQLDKMIV